MGLIKKLFSYKAGKAENTQVVILNLFQKNNLIIFTNNK